jgi:hypothetical protein
MRVRSERPAHRVLVASIHHFWREIEGDDRRRDPGALMNNKHTFKINQYPVPGWLDPTITTTPVPPFWNIVHYVNGKSRQPFRTLQQRVRSRTGGQLPIRLLQPEGHGMQSLKQLVDIYKDIDVRMHTMYGNVIHNR